MGKAKIKLSKGKITAITVAAVALLLAVALIIINCFIPVKYLASYMVARNKGAAAGVMRVRFVDVGYGDCIIIELPDGKNMLIDAGDGKSSNTARILKYLNQSGIGEIDCLVCSSVNAEHCGGLAEIIKYKTVRKIYMPYCENTYVTDEYRSFVLAARSSGAELVISEAGSGESFGLGCNFTVLSPSAHTNPDGEYSVLNSNPSSLTARNNASAVIWLEYAGTCFLFTGDAADGALKGICNSYSLLREDYFVNLENCNVITVACHGSENSACADLYDITKPQTAVVSVGKNGYGCPSVNALSNAINFTGDNIYRTDEYGTVTIEVNQSGYEII